MLVRNVFVEIESVTPVSGHVETNPVLADVDGSTPPGRELEDGLPTPVENVEASDTE